MYYYENPGPVKNGVLFICADKRLSINDYFLDLIKLINFFPLLLEITTKSFF